MKNLYLKRVFLLSAFLSVLQISFSQCPAGWNGTATIKWDYRNYLVTTGNYATYVTAAMSTSQNFSIGTNRVNIAFAGVTTTAQNTTNTGNTNSFGSGAAVQYNGNGTITLTFDTVVANLKFSLYDIDVNQTAKVTAKDASGTSLNITMANASGSGINVITGSGGTSPQATAPATAAGLASNTGTLNITISGFSPAGTNGVKTVIITTGGTSGDFWLSDIAACVYSDFPDSYYIVSKPFTGQPAYILANSDSNTASVVNLGSGNSRYVFRDYTASTTKNRWLNSFGYDPYNHYLYYTYDGQTTASANKSLRKYDFNNTLAAVNFTMSSGTSSVILADVGTIGIPVFDQGLESGAAAFYNGSLYVGVEGSNAGSNNSGRYSMIWRVDFTAGVPTKSCQVFASKADNGAGTIQHDWGDIVISNGILYDFNSAGSSITTSNYIHYDLNTGLITKKFYSITPVPGQNGVGWDEKIYWLSSSKDSIARYDSTTSTALLASGSIIAGATQLDWTTVGAGDGSEAFKPPLDYGDAPASYDPVAVDPAVHDYDSTLRLGVNWNAEFAKKTSANATGEGTSDDGFSITPVFTHSQTYYDAYIKVYNHTGAAATLAAWIDFNNDGVFSASEGASINVPVSSVSIQVIHLAWGPMTPISAALTHVFMRLRLTSATNGMTTANMNGYYSNGEVEDYSILVDDVLPVKLISFTAIAVNDSYVNVDWTMTTEMNMKQYSVERSHDGVNWNLLQNFTPVNLPEITQNYSARDASPLGGTSFYRLKMLDYGGNISYSNVQKVDINSQPFSIEKITPNPFTSNLTIRVSLPENGTISVRLMDGNGKTLKSSNQVGNKGENILTMDNLGNLPPGLYIVEVTSSAGSIQQKLVKE